MTTPTDCPVAALARDAAQVLRKRAYFEQRDDQLFATLTQRLYDLEAAACHLHARSVAGAQFQVLVAYGLLDLLYHNAIGEDGDPEAAMQFGQIKACLESAGFALRGDDAEPLLDFWMTRALETEALAA